VGAGTPDDPEAAPALACGGAAPSAKAEPAHQSASDIAHEKRGERIMEGSSKAKLAPLIGQMGERRVNRPTLAVIFEGASHLPRAICQLSK
jgi:hypothetical protein